jgi:hypothetical protein
MRISREKRELCQQGFKQERKIDMTTAEAIRSVFVSPNIADSNLEPANLVDVMANLAQAAWGISKGLDRIAKAIDGLAEAVKDRQAIEPAE